MADPGLILAGARPIADFLGVNKGQVYYWAKRGRLPVFRVGEILCAEKEALRRWVAEQQSAASRATSSEAA